MDALDMVRNLLLAGQIVGLDPVEMTAIALDELKREEERGKTGPRP